MATIRLNVINSDSSILRINNLAPDDVSFCEAGGNVGIGGVPVGARLYVEGNAVVTSTIDSTSPTIGAVVVSGGISISSSSDAVSATNGGSFTTAGGVGIGKKLYIGSTLISADSTASTDVSTGSVQLSGGISISNSTDSVSVANGGTFTTAGGISVAKKFYLGGHFVSTDATASVSNSTGSLILSGGIGISNTTNAVSAANGGTLTTAGGIGVAKDVYIGGYLRSENPTSSTSNSTGSVILLGGISISNATDAVNATNGGTFTTAGGVAIEKQLFVGSTSNLIGPVLILNSTDAASSTNGGALTISGGAAVGKKLYVGDTTSSTSSSTGSIITSGGIGLSNTTDASSTTNGGSITTAGGVGIAKSLYVGLTSNLAGPVLITDTTEATSVTSGGSLTVSGGTAIAKKLFVGSTINSEDTTISDSPTTGSILVAGGIGIRNTTDATSVTNGGSLTTAGGVAIGKSLYVGNNSTISGVVTVTNTVASTSSTAGSIVSSGGLSISNSTDASDLSNGGSITTAGGASIAKQLFLGGLATFASGISIPSTTPSTSPSTGSLVLSGGLGINNSTDAINSVNGGSFTTAGGIAVGKSGFIGGNLSVSGTLFALSTENSISASTGSVIISGGIGISNTTDATSEANGGSFTTAGGIAVGKKLYVGDVVVAGTTSINSHLLTSNNVANVVQIKNTNTNGYSSIQFLDNSGTSKGSFGYANSGTGIGSLLFTGGNILFDTTVVSSFANTTDSTSPTTGSIIISGGVGIAKNVTIGGAINLSSTTPSTSPTSGAFLLSGGIGINNTTDATSATSGGTFTTAGGLAVGKSLYVGTSGNFLSGVATNNGTSASLPAPQHYTLKTGGLNRFSLGLTNTESGANTGSDLVVSQYDDAGNYLDTSVLFYRSTGQVNIMTPLDATSSVDGALMMSGGISISNTTDAVDATNGGTFTTAGGMAVAKKLFVGNSVNVNNMSTTTVSVANLFVPSIETGNRVIVNIGKDSVQKDSINIVYTHSLDGSDSNYGSIGMADVPDIIKFLPNNAVSIPTGSLQIGIESYTGGKVNIKNAGTGGAIRILPSTSGTESGIGFTRNADASVTVNGDYWVLGQNVLDAGDRSFAIGILDGSPSILITPDGKVSLPIGFIIASTTPSTSPTTGALTLVGGIGINNTTNAVDVTNGGTFTTAGGASIAKKIFVGENATFASEVITNTGTSVNGVVHYRLQRGGLSRISLGLDGLESTGNAGSNLAVGRYNDAGAFVDNVMRIDRSTGVVQLRSSNGAALISVNPSQGDIVNQIIFIGGNNISTPANVTGLTFTNSVTRSFVVHLTVVIDATVDLFAQFELRGIQNATGWHFTQSFIGDNVGVIFTITSAGQIQYISAIYAGFFSMTMKFRATTISI